MLKLIVSQSIHNFGKPLNFIVIDSLSFQFNLFFVCNKKHDDIATQINEALS